MEKIKRLGEIFSYWIWNSVVKPENGDTGKWLENNDY